MGIFRVRIHEVPKRWPDFELYCGYPDICNEDMWQDNDYKDNVANLSDKYDNDDGNDDHNYDNDEDDNNFAPDNDIVDDGYGDNYGEATIYFIYFHDFRTIYTLKVCRNLNTKAHTINKFRVSFTRHV